ncbi:MAG: N-acetyltransferase family protein [Coriobacteriia bacterium]|nr:N-acetyltransferase family protein [Coriobacteriia bacterium]
MTIREAMTCDIESIARIYNHYVLHGTATFDTEPKSVEDRRAWLDSRGPRHPVLVALVDDEVVGWGSLSPWHTRPAYDDSVEVSTYVDPEHLGKGIGSQLMEALIARASDIGHHAVISQIVAGNEASLALGERFGFEEVGRLPEVGRKFGQLLDVVLMIRLI